LPDGQSFRAEPSHYVKVSSEFTVGISQEPVYSSVTDEEMK
jgi:hypothetical protein